MMSANPQPLFSIITVNLNHAAGLEKTLQSVLDQRGERNWEQLVIDGGSTDGSQAVMQVFSEMITYQVSEEDTGIYQAMNKGTAAAKGRYLLFLNSGDTLCDPEILQYVTPHLADEPEILYGNSRERVELPGEEVWKERRPPFPLTPLIFFRSGVCHQAMFFHRSLLEKLGGYNERYRIAGDWDLIARALLKDCTTHYVDRSIAGYEGAGISRKQQELSETEKQRIINEHFPASVQRDYRDYLACRRENLSLVEVETWRQRIRNQPWIINLAMITKWAFTKEKPS